MYLNKKGKKFYYLYYKKDGKWAGISTKCKGLIEANRFREAFQLELNQPNPVTLKASITLQQLYDQIQTANLNLVPATQASYLRTLRKFIDIIGDKPLVEITKLDIENFKYQRSQIIIESSVNIELRWLRAIFYNCMLRWEVVDRDFHNPVKGIKFFKLPEKQRLCFNDEQLQQLLPAIKNPIIKQMFLVALYTACRIGEILNLQWSDIDLENRILMIQNKEDFKTKNRQNRKIVISDVLYQLFREIQGASNIIELNPESYLFLTQSGKRYKQTYVSSKFSYYCRNAGLPDKFHFHCSRHTAITRLIQQGVPLVVVQQIAGHKNYSTTLLYCHLTEKDQQGHLDKLNYNL